MFESKYKVGDRVLLKNYCASRGAMIPSMLEEFGGKVCTIESFDIEAEGTSSACAVYHMAEDEGGYYKYDFYDEDIECMYTSAMKPSQRIEIPVPGGHLCAETCGGGDYPAIHIYFVASGDTLEHDLCFAEVCAIDNPDVIRVGTYFHEGDDVKDIFEYPMWKE